MPRVTSCYSLLLLLLVLTACRAPRENELVVYSALDQEFSEPILDDFAASSGIEVVSNFDIESTKTVGLVNRIINEQNNPRCDLFWNNELLHTIRLQKLGLLEPYESPIAAQYPSDYVDTQHYWHGFAARARILIVNTNLVPEAQRPSSIQDLVDPKWKGKVGVAKPLFGTTATHAAVLFAEWGDEKAKEFFLQLKANAKILSGNKQVALDVASGKLAFGITDTDDAIIEIEKNAPVVIVVPDQGEHEMGALRIPNTLAIIKGGKNTAAAKQLVDHLLSSDVEERLANGPSAQIPLRNDVVAKSRALPSEEIRWMEVDFAAAADAWDEAATFLRENLTN